MTVWFVRLALVLVPLVLAWLWLRHRQAGAEAGRFLSPLTGGLALVWLAALAVIIAGVLQREGAPGSVYTPARVQDGKVVPGSLQPPEP